MHALTNATCVGGIVTLASSDPLVCSGNAMIARIHPSRAVVWSSTWEEDQVAEHRIRPT